MDECLYVRLSYLLTQEVKEDTTLLHSQSADKLGKYLAVSNFNTFQWYFDLIELISNRELLFIPESLKIKNSMIIIQAEKIAFNQS